MWHEQSRNIDYIVGFRIGRVGLPVLVASEIRRLAFLRTPVNIRVPAAARAGRRVPKTTTNLPAARIGRMAERAMKMAPVRAAEPYPMATELLKELVEAGVHFGHQSKKWNPKMRPFLLEKRNNIHLINLEETVRQLEAAANFLAGLAAEGKKILFVGCKRQAQDAVKEAAVACNQFYVNHRWLGGTLTNLKTVRNSVKRLDYLENIEKSPDFKKMSKSELAGLGRERAKLQRNLAGIRGMDKPPDAVVIVDTARETIAVSEARRLGVRIVGLVDSNADPDIIDYPIAANDDAIRSIRVLLQKLVDPIISAKPARQTGES
jgi:small subunit ribosomal protein S2